MADLSASAAPTLAYDSAVMGDESGATVPGEIAAQVSTRTPQRRRRPRMDARVAHELAKALHGARLEILRGEGHVVEPERLAKVVDSFLHEGAGS